MQASAIAGDPTTVRVVTGEIPVRFVGYIPPNVVMNTFDRKYPVLTVRLPAGTPVPDMPSPGPVQARVSFALSRPFAGQPVRWSRLGKIGKTGKPAWCRHDSQWGTLPFECGSPPLAA